VPQPLRDVHVSGEHVCGISTSEVAWCWTGLGNVRKEVGQR
jgi:hypothetical protein